MTDSLHSTMNTGDVAIATGVIIGFIIDQLTEKQLIDPERLREDIARHRRLMAEKEILKGTIEAYDMIAELAWLQK